MERVAINTEDINRYGYRILTAGIDTRAFAKNPVFLWNHNTYGMMPIGKVDDIKIENGKLTGLPVFDDEDDFGKAAKRKFEKGMLNAVSLNVRIIERSEDPAFLKKGQTRATVTKCELLEVSLVNVPGNGAAVKLSGNEGSEALDDLLPKLQLNFNKQTAPDMDVKKIALALGLDENASESAILSAITTAKSEADAARTDRVNALLSLAEKKGVVTKINKDAFERMAKLSYDDAKAMVDGAPDVEEASTKTKEETDTLSAALSAVKGGGKKTAGDKSKDDWTFDEWSKKDPDGLLSMKNDDPQKYKTLVLAYEPA